MAAALAPRRAGTSGSAASCMVQPATSSMSRRAPDARAPPAGPRTRRRGGRRTSLLARSRRDDDRAVDARRGRGLGTTSRPTSKQHAPMHGPIAATSSLAARSSTAPPATTPPATPRHPAWIAATSPARLVRHEHRHAVGDAHADRARALPARATSASASCPGASSARIASTPAPWTCFTCTIRRRRLPSLGDASSASVSVPRSGNPCRKPGRARAMSQSQAWPSADVR